MTLADEKLLLNKQKWFTISILEQKCLASDGIIFIHIHSDTGDATAVYSDLVECYINSTTAKLSASEIKQDLSTFHLNDTWKKPSLMFPNTWATRIPDLNLVLIHYEGYDYKAQPFHVHLTFSSL
jgi:hypothetical protein